MKPMLACPAPKDGLRFPLYSSAKLDGIRCLVVNGVAMSRKLEPLPNKWVQRVLGYQHMFDGLDGELCVGAPYSPTLFNDTQSAVMAVDGRPEFTFHVFDVWSMPAGTPYKERLASLRTAFELPQYASIQWLKLLEQRIVTNAQELSDMQEDHLERGYEGLIVRSFDGPYKHGRSTPKQGIMMKIKKFASGEARIVACNEMQFNENELEEDALGHAKRSHAKDGKVAAGVLGSFGVVDCETGVPFNIGSGFTPAERAQHWANYTGQPARYSTVRDGVETWHTVAPDGPTPLGRIGRYKHFEIGAKTAPRFPIWQGFRDLRDMGEPSSAVSQPAAA